MEEIFKENIIPYISVLTKDETWGFLQRCRARWYTLVGV